MNQRRYLSGGTARPIILSTVTALGMAFAVLVTICLARICAVPVYIDLPSYLLPGSPLPEEAQCALNPYACSSSTWFLLYDGQEVQLHYDREGRKILVTAISGHDYKIGDLITIWGTPSGFAQYGRGIAVYWGTRFAYLNACSFRPDGRVELIAYYLEPPVASPWRGFTSSKDYQCSGQ